MEFKILSWLKRLAKPKFQLSSFYGFVVAVAQISMHGGGDGE
jgi:hypothetical protein